MFPHLSVTGNVAFAPAQFRAAAARWLAEVDAADLADRMPRQLSGGQAQRVALARALAAEPDVLLLDEPLAGLDVAAGHRDAQVLRRVLARDGRSAVLITHDLLDVLTLADRVLVLEAGQDRSNQARLQRFWRHHASRFGARFAGVNLVGGTADADGVLTTQWGTTWHGSPGAGRGWPASRRWRCSTLRAVAVYRDKPHGSPATPSR